MRDLTHSTGLIIGLPTLGRPVSLEWALSFRSLVPPINFNCTIASIWGKPVAEARNTLVEEAIKQKTKYLFFLGDDVVVPLHTLRQLIFRMEQDPSIGAVGGIYCSKSDPPAPLVFNGNGAGSYWDWKVGEFFEVTGLGMDCTLLRTEIFKDLKKPWFVTRDENEFLDGINHAELWTEDLYFLANLIQTTNWKVYADASIICKHVDIYSGKSYTLPAGSLPTRKLVVEKSKKALDIGCGPMNRTDEFPDYELVRVDIRPECEPDYRCDVRQLPFGNDEFDLIFSSHVLEHFPRGEWEPVLNEWLRVLKPGGSVLFYLPNVEWAINNWRQEGQEVHVMNVLYGAQTNSFDFHYNAWYPDKIARELELRGIKDISIEHSGYNMIVKGVKDGT